MEGDDFYEEILRKHQAVTYMKKLEAAVAPDALINIRTIMSSIATNRIDNLSPDAGLSNRNNSFSPGEVNTIIDEPVAIKAENHEVFSGEDAESDNDSLESPDEVKVFIESESDESSNENRTGEKRNSKRLCKRRTTSKNTIEEPTDSDQIENEMFAEVIIRKLINNAVIMENIFKHLPLTALLSFRTVSTDLNNKIIFHLDKNNILKPLGSKTWTNKKFISLIKSSTQIPFTKFNLLTRPQLKGKIPKLLTICGSSIKHLNIRVSDFTKKLSRLLPNLESLYLLGNLKKNSNRKSEEAIDMIAPILLSKLTDIKYTLRSYKAVRTFFKCTPNLNRIEIRNSDSFFLNDILTDLRTVGRLVNITKLHLDTLGEFNFNILFHAALTTGLFLEELCVNKIDNDIDLDYLIEFLSTQGKSLKKLEILKTFQPPKLLKPSQQSKPNRRKIYNLKLKNMVALTSLAFCIAKNGIRVQIENALENLPNLVQVTIPEISVGITESLSAQFCCPTVTKLVVVKARDQSAITSLGIMFPSVKSLKFNNASHQFVNNVTRVWPTLKHLNFDFERHLDTKLMDITNLDEIHRFFPSLLKLKDLETLSIFELNSQSKSMEQRFFACFEKGNQSSN